MKPVVWSPLLTAFTTWFAHFMACWAASEFLSRPGAAHAVAGAATVLALLALGVHLWSAHSQRAAGVLPDWSHRFAQGAVALATVAVLFNALTAIVLRP